MAIPFSTVDQEVPQLSLPELIRELCEILRQLSSTFRRLRVVCRQLVIMYRGTVGNFQRMRRNRASTSRIIVRQDRVPEIMTNLSLLSTAFGSRHDIMPIRNLRQRARRHRTTSESSCCEESKNIASSTVTTATPETVVDDTSNQQWIEVGMELEEIAHYFKSPEYKEDEIEEESNSSSKPNVSVNPSSKFSKFLPPPFTCWIFTAVICVVGWRLRSR